MIQWFYFCYIWTFSSILRKYFTRSHDSHACLTSSIVVVQSPSHIWLFAILRTAARQAYLSLMMPSSHLILWSPLLLPSIFPSIRDFPQWVLCSQQMTKILELQLQSFQWIFRVWSPLRLTGVISLLSKELSGVFSSTTVGRHQFFGVLPSLRSTFHNHDILKYSELDIPSRNGVTGMRVVVV